MLGVGGLLFPPPERFRLSPEGAAQNDLEVCLGYNQAVRQFWEKWLSPRDSVACGELEKEGVLRSDTSLNLDGAHASRQEACSAQGQDDFAMGKAKERVEQDDDTDDSQHSDGDGEELGPMSDLPLWLQLPSHVSREEHAELYRRLRSIRSGAGMAHRHFRCRGHAGARIKNFFYRLGVSAELQVLLAAEVGRGPAAEDLRSSTGDRVAPRRLFGVALFVRGSHGLEVGDVDSSKSRLSPGRL